MNEMNEEWGKWNESCERGREKGRRRGLRVVAREGAGMVRDKVERAEKEEKRHKWGKLGYTSETGKRWGIMSL